MVTTIVLVVSNKPIQRSMNNTSSDSKVTMRVGRHFPWLTNPWRMAPCKLGNIEISEKKKRVYHLRRRNIEISERKKHVEDLGHDV